MTEKEARDARLAAQLRANLKRRKAAPMTDGTPRAEAGNGLPTERRDGD